MSDVAPETGNEVEQASPAEAARPDTGGPDLGELQRELDKYKALHRKQEERAKSNAAAVQELAKLREQSMTDMEKAVALARTEATQAAAVRFGGQVVDAQVALAAKDRSIDVPTLLQGLDRSRFLNEDGEPDVKAIAAWVDRLSPKPTEPTRPGYPDLGQGARGITTAATPSAAMNSAIRAHRK